MTKTRAIVFVVVFLYGSASIPASGSEFIVVGKQAEVALVDPEKGSQRLLGKADLERGDYVGEAVMGEDSAGAPILFMSSAVNHVTLQIALCTSQPRPSRLAVSSRGVLFERGKRAPVLNPVVYSVPEQGGRPAVAVSSVTAFLADNRQEPPTPDNLFFVSSNMPREGIPEGKLQPGELCMKFPPACDAIREIWHDAWMLIGRSSEIVSYGVIPRDIVTTLSITSEHAFLFFGRDSCKYSLLRLRGWGYGHVYDEVAAVETRIPQMGINGGYMTPLSSGEYAFFFPDSGRVVKTTVDPGFAILYASNSIAFFAKGNKLLSMRINNEKMERPESVMDLNFKPVIMFRFTRG